MVARVILERDLEGYFARQCKKKGLMTLKLNVRFSRGWPDRIVVLKDGKVMWVELKRPGAKLSPLQVKVHFELNKWNQEVYVIDSKEGIDNVLATA
tara:strand:+ start:27952 stop:28239 length:288 start_codon:yes stop_codon:yes gene_type:complete